MPNLTVHTFDLNLLYFIVFSLCLWRFAHMIVYEHGFMGIFFHIRILAKIVHDESGDPIVYPDTNLAQLLSCVWCLSMFLAIPYSILIYWFQEIMLWLSLPFALSAGAIVFGSMIDRRPE